MNSNQSQREIGDPNRQIFLYQQTNDEELATSLIMHYESIVSMAARKMSRNRPDLEEDLLQVGRISLLRSLQQFDTQQGTAFEAYAMSCMIGYMKNYLRDKAWHIQVPRWIKEKGIHIKRAIDELTLALGRSPEISEIAAYMDLTIEETIEILSGQEYYHAVSLETPLKGEGESTIADLIPSEADEFKKLELRLDLQDALSILGEQERRILQLVYKENWPQRKIAEHLAISQMSVSRIQKRAVSKLKKALSNTSK